MTDLDHLVELLHRCHPDRALQRGGSAGRAGQRRHRGRPPEVDGDVTARRVESEAKAVQVMTVWTAKGLEFPDRVPSRLWRRRAPTVR